MSFKCGNCGNKHDFVWESQECTKKSDDDSAASVVLDRITGTGGNDDTKPRDAQVDYCLGLLSRKVWPDSFSREDLMVMERRQVSRLISALKASPTKVGATESREPTYGGLPDVPAGRYALLKTHPNPEESSEESDYDFFQVDKPTEGKWVGYTFVQQLFGAPGDYRRESLNKTRRVQVLKKIAADPEKASLAYGRVSEICGVCHSPLTNKDSRKRGIGPYCASKTGWGA